MDCRIVFVQAQTNHMVIQSHIVIETGTRKGSCVVMEVHSFGIYTRSTTQKREYSAGFQLGIVVRGRRISPNLGSLTGAT